MDMPKDAHDTGHRLQKPACRSAARHCSHRATINHNEAHQRNVTGARGAEAVTMEAERKMEAEAGHQVGRRLHHNNSKQPKT